MKRTYIKIVGEVIILLLLSVNLVSAIEFNAADTLKGNVDFSGENRPAIVYVHRFDLGREKYIKQPVAKLSLEEINQLKNELQKISHIYTTSEEQIKQQIQLMYKWKFISDETYYDLLEVVSFYNEKTHNTSSQIPLQTQPGSIICGPSLISFLSIGGSILPIHDLLFHSIIKPIWRANLSDVHLPFLNGTQFHPFLGIMPAVIFLGLSATLINVIGIKIGETPVISPFLALLAPHASFGISISIFENSYPINVMDWSIGISAIGIIAPFYS